MFFYSPNQLFVEKLIAFCQAPFGQPKKPAALGDRLNPGCKDFLKKMKNPLPGKFLRGSVVMERGSPEVLLVQLRGCVHMSNIVRQFVGIPKVMGVDEGVRVKVPYGVPIAPKNRHGIARQRIVHFFRGPPKPLLILKSQNKTVVSKQGQFVADSRKAGVVHAPARRVDALSAVQSLKKSRAFPDRVIRITGKGGAKPCFHSPDLFPVLPAPDQGLGRAVEGKNGKMEDSGIRQLDGKNCKVTFLPVGQISFVMNVNLGTVVKPMAMSRQGINQKIRSIIPSNSVFFFENRQKKVFKLDRTIGKVQGYLLHQRKK